MSFAYGRSTTGQHNAEYEEAIDLDALEQVDDGLLSKPTHDTSRIVRAQLIVLSVIQKVLCYPPQGSLKLGPTSWLDGVRGVAALEVFIFHGMGIWASIVPAWGRDENGNISFNILQFPFIRTFFVSGGAAVCVFFVLSGYVLTQRSLRWIREGSRQQVYPAVASSMFRRGFRLYLPPLFTTFCEMLATRFGFAPPLSFTFAPEPTFFAQFLDWIAETNRFANPFWNFPAAIRGGIAHNRYDAVVWTIPVEYYGSFMCYLLLFVLVWIPSNGMRMGLVAVFSIFWMGLGCWNLFCFSSGMLIADFNLGQGDNPSPKYGKVWVAIFAASFYVAGFPTLMMGKLPMPGFEIVYSLIPQSLSMEDHARFPWSISGVLLLLSISQLPRLKALFETYFCQYLGKIAFSLYLIHEFSLTLFGLGLQGVMLRIAGLEQHAHTVVYWLLCALWYILFAIPVFALAAQVERWIDGPSVKFARWLEGKCLKCYRKDI